MSKKGRYHDGYIEDIVGALAGDFLALALIALVIVAYLIFLAIVLIMRSFAKHPTSKALWVSLGIFLLCFLFAVATQGQSLFLVLAG
jgi:predicted branched-subunit amino acid permease